MDTVDVYTRVGYFDVIVAALSPEWKCKVVAWWTGNHEVLPGGTPDGDGDLIVSCHWPRLFSDEQIQAHKYGGLNLHPNLSLGYKVENPVGRALEDGHTLMSVACHRIISEPDGGEILAEHWRTVPEGSTTGYVYHLLHPLYRSVLEEALTCL